MRCLQRVLLRVGAVVLSNVTLVAAQPPDTPLAAREKTLVVYAYSQHSPDAYANLRYFLRFGAQTVAVHIAPLVRHSRDTIENGQLL